MLRIVLLFFNFISQYNNYLLFISTIFTVPLIYIGVGLNNCFGGAVRTLEYLRINSSARGNRFVPEIELLSFLFWPYIAHMPTRDSFCLTEDE